MKPLKHFYCFLITDVSVKLKKSFFNYSLFLNSVPLNKMCTLVSSGSSILSYKPTGPLMSHKLSFLQA